MPEKEKDMGDISDVAQRNKVFELAVLFLSGEVKTMDKAPNLLSSKAALNKN